MSTVRARAKMGGISSANPHLKTAPKGRSTSARIAPILSALYKSPPAAISSEPTSKNAASRGHGGGNADAFERTPSISRKAHDEGDAAPCQEVSDREDAGKSETRTIDKEQNRRTPQRVHLFRLSRRGHAASIADGRRSSRGNLTRARILRPGLGRSSPTSCPGPHHTVTGNLGPWFDIGLESQGQQPHHVGQE
jgi:hypothetical protein